MYMPASSQMQGNIYPTLIKMDRNHFLMIRQNGFALADKDLLSAWASIEAIQEIKSPSVAVTYDDTFH